MTSHVKFATLFGYKDYLHCFISYETGVKYRFLGFQGNVKARNDVVCTKLCKRHRQKQILKRFDLLRFVNITSQGKALGVVVLTEFFYIGNSHLLLFKM